jgi:Hint domain
MPNFDKESGAARRTRRSLTKAAGIAAGALLALSVKSKVTFAAVEPEHCFLRGTKILTTTGYRNVEDLSVGDFLSTRCSGSGLIKWISSQSFEKADRQRPWAVEARPVRIARSALDDNVPDADLLLTAAHALFIDGFLVPAGDLVNGTTITLDEADELDRLEYFHIKLEKHGVIYAQGASCETLLSLSESDATFDDYVRKYGPQETSEIPCAPRLGFNGRRAELRSRLRSAVSVWLDRRQALDIIRDRIEERGVALSQDAALVGLARTNRLAA